MEARGRRILVLFAHPSQERSEINRHLAIAAQSHAAVTFVDLYAEYPDYRIDIDREQRRLLDHDVVMFLHPLYWYSTPAILKEWQDLVLEHGFAYGHEGKALLDKYFLCAVTAGGAEDAYASGGYNHFSLRELLRPLEQTATLCSMHYLPPFALFAARTALAEGRLPAHRERFVALLNSLASDALDPWLHTDATTLNALLGQGAIEA